MSITDFAIEMQEANLLDSGDMRVGEDIQETTVLCQVPTNQPEKPIRRTAKKKLQKRPLLADRERASATIPFERIDPDILAYAPIHFYLRDWCDGRYSRQCLRRMLTTVIDQESWHALRGVEEHRALHASNCVLIECLLRALDEREVENAA